MTNEIEYKEPNEEQLKLMREFASICSQGMQLIMKCQPDSALMHASARLQEALGWMNTFVMNGGKLEELDKNKH